MAKSPPSFNLYPGDLVKSCMEMSATEFGAYMRLLCYQWEHGAVPNDTAKLSRICGMERGEFVSAWTTIEGRFDDDETGNLKVQSRLAEQREKDIKTWTARKQGGKKGGRPSKKQGESLDNRKPQGLGGGSQNKTSTEKGIGKREKVLIKEKESVSNDEILSLPIPAELDQPGFTEAWSAWVEYKQAAPHRWKHLSGPKAQLTRLRSHADFDGLVPGIYNSISSEWEGIYPDRAIERNGGGRKSPVTFAQQRIANTQQAALDFINDESIQ